MGELTSVDGIYEENVDGDGTNATPGYFPHVPHMPGISGLIIFSLGKHEINRLRGNPLLFSSASRFNKKYSINFRYAVSHPYAVLYMLPSVPTFPHMFYPFL